MKRIPRARLDAEIHMHRIANFNMIRNWVGQSTSEDFYELCDKYGILLWDEFFQPNPSDGPNPDDVPALPGQRARQDPALPQPSVIALWCARNEGDPPPDIDNALEKMIAELDPRGSTSPARPRAAASIRAALTTGATPRELLHVHRGALQNGDRQHVRPHARSRSTA